jgi:hypothetical protein
VDDITQPSTDCQQLNAVEQVCSSGFEERPTEYSASKLVQEFFEIISGKFFTSGQESTDTYLQKCKKAHKIGAKLIRCDSVKLGKSVKASS